MATRVPPKLPVPPQFAQAVQRCMAAAPLQHQDELVGLLTWTQGFEPPLTFGTVVEIGTHGGGSLTLWAELAQRVIAIDLPCAWAGLPYDQAVKRDAAFQQRYPHTYCLLGNSHDPTIAKQLRRILGNEAIDLLFIDGDHSRWGVEDDYQRYRGFVRPGGVIAFHDVNDSDRNRLNGLGVADFFQSLPEPKQTFSVGYEWGGIGALRQ